MTFRLEVEFDTVAFRTRKVFYLKSHAAVAKFRTLASYVTGLKILSLAPIVVGDAEEAFAAIESEKTAIAEAIGVPNDVKADRVGV